jgi:midasin
MERVAACVRMHEPVLLVGETGTGKTTAVQHLAERTGRQLLVHNLSEQSDSSELIGGFRPVQLRHVLLPLVSRFEATFVKTFSRARNAALLDKLQQRFARGEWKKLLQLMSGTLRTVYARIERAPPAAAQRQSNGGGGSKDDGSSNGGDQRGGKRQRVEPPTATSVAPSSALSTELIDEWHVIAAEVARVQRQVDNPSEEGVAFSFVEGTLVRALREGHWLLLDEMNLASAETLERVAAVLEEGGSIALTERGEADALARHPDFRIFGAMNPPTDFGKKELPPGIRTRFTELYVEPLSSEEDLQLVVLGTLQPVLPHPPVREIVAFYVAAMAEADRTLLDGANQRPQYSLRTLCRALAYVAGAAGRYGLARALWDGFHMTFVTQLQQRHQAVVEGLLLSHLLPQRGAGKPSKPPPMNAPSQPSDGGHWVEFSGFWVANDPRGTPRDDHKYIVTPTVQARLQYVARMVAARRFPVLLQGPTSAGKTSMVERLARATGHRLVRINNHEHTDVQEYIGSFQPGPSGKLEFCDGALTQAVRHGYWIVLDELNLAPSEVLEALNRLLDDNRELLLPETGEVVRPHPHFMLFATQNPPGSYGGRKVLSRAFRNRFVHLQMDEIPTAELAYILEKRCAALSMPTRTPKHTVYTKELGGGAVHSRPDDEPLML